MNEYSLHINDSHLISLKQTCLLAKIRTLSIFCLTKTRCEIPLVGPVMLSHVVVRFNYCEGSWI